MLYKNSIKLLFSNFNKVWQTLLYIIVTGIVLVGLAIACAFPIYKVLLSNGIFTEFSDTYMAFLDRLNIQDFIVGISDCFKHFITTITSNISTLWVYILLLAVVIVVFGVIIMGLYSMAVSESLNYSMSSNVKQGTLSCLFSTLKTNLKYRLVYLITMFPVNILITYILYLLLGLIENIKILFIVPTILIVAFVLLDGLKLAIFGQWLPSIVVKNKSIFGGFKENFRVMPRRFFENFGSAVALLLTIIFVNIFGGICTFGVGLIITIPSTLVLINIFNMTAYFTSIGQNFYVDSSNVIAPKKQEFTDRLHDHRWYI